MLSIGDEYFSSWVLLFVNTNLTKIARNLSITVMPHEPSGTSTHWGWVTHLCISILNFIGSDNGLEPVRWQAIIWTNDGILLIGPLGTNFSEILIEIHTFSFKKMHFKRLSGKWQPFCLSLNVWDHQQRDCYWDLSIYNGSNTAYSYCDIIIMISHDRLGTLKYLINKMLKIKSKNIIEVIIFNFESWTVPAGVHDILSILFKLLLYDYGPALYYKLIHIKLSISTQNSQIHNQY